MLMISDHVIARSKQAREIKGVIKPHHELCPNIIPSDSDTVIVTDEATSMYSNQNAQKETYA